ncbi:MAG: hypothetical protein ACPGVH_00375 [Chitinophagales bacterium]
MKTKIYLVIFALLAVFAAYTIYTSSEKNSTKAEKAFKVENFEKVTKIVVTNRQTEEMVFEKQDESWILNGKYPVRTHLFEEMQEALTKMEAVSPVPEVGKEAVLRQMIGGAIKVEVFKGKKLDKKVFIGGPNLKNTASHMFLEIDGEPSNRIYNVGIPGFRGYLTSRFNVNESQWRSKLIFSLAANEVKEVELNYNANAENANFVLQNENANFSLKINNKEIEKTLINDANVVNYLKMFDNQQVTSYVFTEPKEQYLKDSLLQVNKFADLKITDLKGNTTAVTIVNMPLNESSKRQYDNNGDLFLYDQDYKYIVFGEEQDWGVVSRTKFGLILISPNLLLKNNAKTN